MMQLFQFHDDPTHECQADERWWGLVWAVDYQQGLAIAASHYSGDGPLCEAVKWEEFFGGSPVAVETPELAEHRPKHPKFERNAIVQRLAGWSECDEDHCDSCGLAAMGIPRYAVCDGCNQCKECGCDCEED